MKLFNEKNPTKKTSLIATLTAHYGDKGLTKIVEAAERVPSTATIAKRVQNEQIQRWLGHGKTPDKVFAMLNLDEAGTHFFMHPQMNTWVKYTDDFNKAYPDTEITLLSVLSKRFKEETVVQMLIAAKKVPSTENLAVKIQAEQAKLWLSKGKTPAEVLALLHLGKQENSLFSNPLFTAWIEYTDEYNKIYFGTRNTAIPALKAYYNDDVLAKMILAAKKNPSTSSLSKRMYDELVRSWSTNKLAPQLVFSVSNLHKTGDRVLEQPLFSVWLRYLVAYSDANPRAKVTLLSQLSNIYGGNRLSKLLISAEKVPSTKRLASDLLSTQLQGWLTTKKDPVEVFFLLGVQGTAKNSVPNVLYQNYNAAFKQLKK